MSRVNVQKINEKKIAELESEQEVIEKKLKELKEKLTNPEQDRLSLERFLTLSKNAAEIVKSGDAVQKDIICREIFLNLTTDETKVLSYQAK